MLIMVMIYFRQSNFCFRESGFCSHFIRFCEFDISI